MSPVLADTYALAGEIRDRCLWQGEISDGEFDELAWKLFEYQYANNPVYSHYVNLVGIPSDVADIPHVPAHFFRSRDVTSFDHELEDFRRFASDGFNHTVWDTDLIIAAGMASLRRYVIGAQVWQPWAYQVVCVMSVEQSMFTQFARAVAHSLGDDHSRWEVAGSVRSGAVFESLNGHFLESNQPAMVIGSTKTFRKWFADLGRLGITPVDIHPDSLIIEADAVGSLWTVNGSAECCHIFGMSYDRIFRVYVRPYLSTPFFSQGPKEDVVFEVPPWVHMAVVDEETKEPTDGVGVLQVTDLANFWSCAFVETDDGAQKIASNKFVLR